MNYQPFFGMHVLVSDEFLIVSKALGGATLGIILAIVAIYLTHFLMKRI